jgi:hypothetical protein
MFQANVYNGDWIDKSKLVFPAPVEIFNNIILPVPASGAKRILTVFSEPEPYRVSNALVIEYHSTFDLILTYDQEILNSCPNSKLFILGTTWLHPSFYQDIDIMKKKFEVSFLCGAKTVTQGHILRQKLWYRQKEITIPKTFWISGALPVENINNNPILPVEPISKRMLFDSQFHITIENVKSDNFFTEKLIDCFISMTIPIYWGCPNINQYFDQDGIYSANDEQEIIDICNNLSPNEYFYKLNIIEYNSKECLKYCKNTSFRLSEVIKNALF